MEFKAPTENRTDAARKRLVAVALEIINETGDFDLPMRALAARAQVSLRKPYEIFGSKQGVITAVLKSDQVKWRDKLHHVHARDDLERLFIQLRLGIEHLALNQRFYRALFRATHGYSGGDETEPARENLPAYIRLTRRAIDAGLLRPDLDEEVFGEALTSLWAANMRNWAASEGDIEIAAALIECAFAAALAGVATVEGAARMRRRLLRGQAEYRRLLREHAGAAPEPALPAKNRPAGAGAVAAKREPRLSKR